MTTQEFDELAGRIEGIARSVLILSATLHRRDVLDEQKLQADLRIAAEGLGLNVPGRAVVAQTLEDMADQLLADFRYLKSLDRNQTQ